jgi:hypothetical protein
MGIEFHELVTWMRRRKIFASLLVTLTLGIGIIIGTLISGRAQAIRDQTSSSGAALLVVPDPVTLSNSFTGSARRSVRPW